LRCWRRAEGPRDSGRSERGRERSLRNAYRKSPRAAERHPALIPVRLPGLRHTAESAERGGACLLARHAAPHVFFHSELKVRFEFLVEVNVEPAAAQK
jgi:hypothetical protein